MQTRTKVLIAAATVVVVVGGGTAAVAANPGDDPQAPITGTALEQASDAALDHVGEGRVTDTEVGDEDSYYEVEVTKDDGSEVDVQLDRDFSVVGEERDGAENGEDEHDDDNDDDNDDR
jgi:hypothetical protein